MLSWDNKGKYCAELVWYRDVEPVVFIRFENRGGEEVVIGVSYDGTLRSGNGSIFQAQIRISSHTPIALNMKEYGELQMAIREARKLLGKIKKYGRARHISDEGNKTFCGLTVDNKVWVAAPKVATCKSCLLMCQVKGVEV